MKILTKEEFYKCPEGTFFSLYSPCIFYGLRIKYATIYIDELPVDFYCKDLIGNIKDFNRFCEIEEIVIKNRKSIDLDFDSIDRDGIYDESQLYAVYEKEELIKFNCIIESYI